MKRIKTTNLTDLALGWAVAKCEGYFDIDMAVVRNGEVRVHYFDKWAPFTDWAQGGPIIEREGISINDTTMRGEGGNFAWCATRKEGPAVCEAYGLTPLIAAMRCFVASQLGDQVDIPEELT